MRRLRGEGFAFVVFGRCGWPSRKLPACPGLPCVTARCCSWVAGRLALSAARFLGEDRIFGRVIAADLIQERAAAASEMCGPKATSARMDALDDEELARDAQRRGAGVEYHPSSAAHACCRSSETWSRPGPPTRTATATRSRFRPCSIPNTWSRLAGYRAVSVLPGLGASPGLTNALTAYLAQRLERIGRGALLSSGWTCGAAALGSGSRTPGRVRFARAGVERQRLAGSVRDDRVGGGDFPAPGRGRCPVAPVGLGPVTLPQSFASLADVSCHRGFADPLMAEIMSDLAGYGFASDEPVDTANGPLSPVEFASCFFSGPHDVWSSRVSEALRPGRHSGWESAGAALRQAVVSGMLRGKKTDFTMTYRFPGEDDADNTAATLAVGGRMLLARELPAPGVHAPESLDPAPFLWNMERRGVEIQLDQDCRGLGRGYVASCIGSHWE